MFRRIASCPLFRKKSRGETKSYQISYFELFKFASKKDLVYIYVAVLLSAAAGAIYQLNSLIFGELFQSIVDYGKSVKQGNVEKDTFLNSINTFATYSSAVGLALLILAYASTVLINIASYKQVFKIRQEFLKAMLGQDFEYFDKHPPGDFTSKMMDDLKKLEEGIGQTLTTFVYFKAMFLTSLIMSIYKGWQLALLCLSTVPITIFLTLLDGKITRTIARNESEAQSRSLAVAEEALSGIRTVYAYNGQKVEVERYRKHLREARRYYTLRVIYNGLTVSLLIFLIHCTFGVAIWYGYYLTRNLPQIYNIQVCTAVLLEVVSGTSNISSAMNLVEVFCVARGAGADIFQVIDRVPKINPYSNSGLVPQFPMGNIELNDVYFHYPTRPNVPVLQGVTLKVKRGQSVALVGQSGAGKSTIIQLICRFYDVVNGSVKIDGLDVRKMSVHWLRAQVSLILPEPVLFNTNVRQNIRYGREDSTFSEIQDAARKANAHNFIMNLPKGYDTVVGERGAALSGGQKQRIAIARALVREPLVLLLDEATSALDSNAQYKLNQVLENIHASHTTLIVSKQLSAIKNVDYIYFLEKGKIVESGKHEALMEKRGRYYQMVQIQAPEEEGYLFDRTASFTKTGGYLFDRTASFTKTGGIIENTETNKVLSGREENATQFNDDFDDEKSFQDDDQSNKQNNDHVTFKQALELSSPESVPLTIASISSFLNGFGTPLLANLTGNVLQALMHADHKIIEAVIRKSMYFLMGLGAVIAIATFMQTYFYGYAGKKLVNRLRRMMFTKMLQQEVAFYDKPENRTGILCERLSAEANDLRGITGPWIGTILQVVGTFSMALTLSFIFDWRIALLALMLSPFIFIIMYKQGRTYDDKSGTENLVDNYLAVEAVTNVRTVASLGREKIFVQQYAKKMVPAMRVAIRKANYRGLMFGLSVGVLNFVFAAALYFGGYIVVFGSESYVNVLKSSQALLLGANSSAQLFAYIPNFKSGMEAASSILSLLHRKPKILESDLIHPIAFRGSGETSLEDVKFNYPTRPNINVLNGITLKVERGKTVALVGLSGNGKSTIVQLLLRFFDPDEGVVCQDGIPLTEIAISEVRYSIGLVQQEPILFHRTIAENIAYGDNSRKPTMEEITDVAKMANIHEFIMSLPTGYETHIGAKGELLSVGQKQRIAIARALIRKPSLLLLDEATSALDSVSELKVQAALDKAKEGRTCLMIVHTLRVIRDVDLIAVVSSGRIVEQGTHNSLMQLKGLYYAMYMFEKQL